MGEIGGNDFYHPFYQKRTLDEIRTYVPSIVKNIRSAINVLIELGAKTLLVPGNFPIGCIPAFLTIYDTGRTEEYDRQTGCIKCLNELSEYHNKKLKDELDRLRQRHSDVTIIYADYYHSLQNIYLAPHKFGFESFALKACCGGGGPYNFNLTADCGEVGFVACNDPSKSISWDGIHMTEAVYKILAEGLIKGPYAVPSIGSFCSNKATHLLNKVSNPAIQG